MQSAAYRHLHSASTGDVMSNSPAMISRGGGIIDEANRSRNDRAPVQAVALSFRAFGQDRGSFVVSPFSISTVLGDFSDSSLKLLLPLSMPLSLSCDFELPLSCDLMLSDILLEVHKRFGNTQLTHVDASVAHYL
jgi:hypothetical protein